MNEAPLFRLLKSVIETGLTAQGVTVIVKQAYQPRQQGTPSTPVVLLSRMPDHMWGFQTSRTVFDLIQSKEISTEKQLYESAFQVNALAIQDPKLIDEVTANDILKMVSITLSSQSTIAALMASGVGILRITDMRNTPFTDDKERFEYSPSFDFTVIHSQVYVSEVPVLQSEEFHILSV